MKCSIRQDGGVHSDRVETRLGAICYGADEVCQNCGSTVKKNDYGDVKPIEHKHNCNKQSNHSSIVERERERERASQKQSNNTSNKTISITSLSNPMENY